MIWLTLACSILCAVAIASSLHATSCLRRAAAFRTVAGRILAKAEHTLVLAVNELTEAKSHWRAIASALHDIDQRVEQLRALQRRARP